MAFFATGDTIVANNLVLNLYQHVNSPEGRLYLSRQLFEEAVHVQFYLTLLDTYVPDETERHEAFAAVENIPSIRRKAEFCFRWIDSVFELRELRDPRSDRRAFLLNLICFAACIEGLFFYGAFAYVYFLRSRGLLNGLASGTNWVFRDESMHMAFAFDVVDTVRARGAGPVRRRAGRAGPRRCWPRRSTCEVAVRRGPARAGRGRAVAGRHARLPASTSPTGGWPQLGHRADLRLDEPVRRSWSCRTCRSCRTSSSAGSRRTRSASTGAVAFDDDF